MLKHGNALRRTSKKPSPKPLPDRPDKKRKILFLDEKEEDSLLFIP
jgi:hypothetical protein